MDGNFRLVRKKSSGVSYTPPHHGSMFFTEKEEYEPFLTKDKRTTVAHDSVSHYVFFTKLIRWII